MERAAIGAGIGVIAAAAAFAIVRHYRGGNAVLSAARALVPCDYGTPKWIAMMGGQTGPGTFAYYSDGWGTTCGVVAAAILEKAGVHPSLINRGGRFVIGEHISRIYKGAKERGYLRTDSDLRPGDLYYVRRPSGVEHVGVIVEKSGADTITADGGQRDKDGRQCARMCKRRFEGFIMIRGGDSAEMRWYVRIP